MHQLSRIVVLILLCVLAAPGASAAGKGALKARFDPDVGFAIANTTASGLLNITVHIDQGEPSLEYFINVRIRLKDGTVKQFIDVATLTTNGHGSGNAQVQLRIEPFDDWDVFRRIAVRVRHSGPPNIVYVATLWDLPLK